MDRTPEEAGRRSICELRSRTTVFAILEQSETSQCFQRGFGKGGLLDELWMLLLRCQANCDVAD